MVVIVVVVIVVAVVVVIVVVVVVVGIIVAAIARMRVLLFWRLSAGINVQLLLFSRLADVSVVLTLL